MRKTLAAILLFCAMLGFAQKPKATDPGCPGCPAKGYPSASKTPPEISAAFSKAVVKALLTIQRDANKDLVDAAMVDVEAEASNYAEKGLVFNVALAEFRHHTLTTTYAHSDETACFAAWLPRLRALSADLPKECASRPANP